MASLTSKLQLAQPGWARVSKCLLLGNTDKFLMLEFEFYSLSDYFAS